MENLERIIAEHSFFAGLDKQFMSLLVGCASNVHFKAGTYILKEGSQADTFYLIRSGKVAVEVVAPQQPADHRTNARSRRSPGVVVAAAAFSVEIPRPRGRRCARPGSRRQVFAHQVRREPRPRLRSLEALRPNHGGSAGGDSSPVTRCLCGSAMMNQTMTTVTTFNPMASAALPCTQRRQGDVRHVHPDAGARGQRKRNLVPARPVQHVVGIRSR